MSIDEMWGDDSDPEISIIANLPAHLRSRCCDPNEPWVSPNSHDHGHTDCYFVNLAADEIERLRAEVEALRAEVAKAYTLGEQAITALQARGQA